jgi:hypothetical protein
MGKYRLIEKKRNFDKHLIIKLPMSRFEKSDKFLQFRRRIWQSWGSSGREG